MALPQMINPADLEDYPGAPFPESVVRAAEASLRAEAGWHIAPVVTEVVTIDAEGGYYLRLPTLRLVSVDSASVNGATVTGYTSSRLGTLHLSGGWPYGFGTVTVTMTHGFDECPAELLPAAADRCRRLLAGSVVQRSESAGPFSLTETFRADGSGALGDPLARYRLPPRFA